MNQQNTDRQSRKKKQFLMFSLSLVFLTSTIPNFLSVIYPDTNLAIKIIILLIGYLLFPIWLILIDDRLFIPWDTTDWEFIFWNWLSNILIVLVFFLILIIFGFHCSFEIKKDLCLNTNTETKQFDLYKQCLKETEISRFKPFL